MKFLLTFCTKSGIMVSDNHIITGFLQGYRVLSWLSGLGSSAFWRYAIMPKGVYKRTKKHLAAMSAVRMGVKRSPMPLAQKLKIRATLLGHKVSAKTRRKIGIAARRQWANPKIRAQTITSMKGSKNHNWCGGISKLPYPFEFDSELKEKVKTRDGYVCRRCKANSSLCVHHIDYNKNNLYLLNLITLCIKCNIGANNRRKFWKKYFTSILKGEENGKTTSENRGGLERQEEAFYETID